MLSKSYLKTFRKCLAKEGIWGRPAKKLTEELEDHCIAKLMSLEEQGHDPGTAKKMALQSVGEPKVVAACAADTLAEGRWIARHPWIYGAALFLSVFILSVAMVTGFAATFANIMHTGAVIHGAWMDPIENFMEWSPFFLGMGLLAWVGRRCPAGWKSLLIASIAIGLAASNISVNVVPALHGPGTGHVYFDFVGLIGFGAMFILNATGMCFQIRLHGPDVFHYFFPLSYMVRLFLPPLLCLALRHGLPANNRAEIIRDGA